MKAFAVRKVAESGEMMFFTLRLDVDVLAHNLVNLDSVKVKGQEKSGEG